MAGKQKGNQTQEGFFIFAVNSVFMVIPWKTESKERGFPLLRFPGDATIIWEGLWASNHSVKCLI